VTRSSGLGGGIDRLRAEKQRAAQPPSNQRRQMQNSAPKHASHGKLPTKIIYRYIEASPGNKKNVKPAND
jgi:hypothetical protein